jgi:hypothetical protein
VKYWSKYWSKMLVKYTGQTYWSKYTRARHAARRRPAVLTGAGQTPVEILVKYWSKYCSNTAQILVKYVAVLQV